MPLRRPVGFVTLLAMFASLLALLPVTAASAMPNDSSPVFINEMHYDNDGTDAGEFVEIANPEGKDLSGWQIVLYNGSGGGSYDMKTLSGSAAFLVESYPSNGIQNGDPDGVALVNATGGLVQFLSYEGVFTATNGPASGVTSTDVGITEAGSESVGQSLQLTGTGSTYDDFEWTAPAEDTPGAANNSQTFQAPGEPAQPVADCEPTLDVDSGTAGSTEVSASDADSRIAGAEIVSTDTPGTITLDGFMATPSGDGGTGSATLNVADDTADGTYDVVIRFSTDDEPAQTVECTVEVTVRDLDAVTPINTVQGDGAASPLAGEQVNVEAVVTSLITDDDVLDGFFLQEEDEDSDDNAETSEGVYVFCRGNCPTELAAGDLARVSGVVGEFNDSTQINATEGSMGSSTVVESGLPLPTAATVELPVESSTRDAATFENVEGMRTTIPTKLAVSEYFNLARFGEIVLTANERPYQYTQTNEPDKAGYDAFLADLATRRIILDDDSNSQNAATTGPDDNEPYFYPTPGLSTGNFFRGGDTITDLTGVFEYSFGAWKLRPVAGEDYTFEKANPRPESPEQVGGRLQVASFNVLNYFATIDETESRDDGPCGPSGTLDCRGADSEAERIRQLDKIVDALQVIDAAVVGLIEIQNDDGAATQQIVDALNTATAPGTYDSIDTGTIGTDAIKQAFIYQPAAVLPVGAFDTLTSTDDPDFDDDRNRPALIQTFEEVGTGERVTVAVNHFKSKGSECGAGDDSPQDGSANCDGTRTAAATALADHLETDPTESGDPDSLIIGDLNSYAMERPISALKDAGYVDLLQRFTGEDAYGYLFDGQLGTLDYGLADETLDAQVTGAGGWKINADEVPLLDYNDTVFDEAGEPSFERKSGALPLFAPDPYRSSDHDPVIVGLNLGDAVEPPVDEDFNLTLLHSNDGESALLPVAPRGGIARFGTLVQDLRDDAEEAGSRDLLISAGDNYLAGPQLQASLESFSDDNNYTNDGPFFDARALDFLDYDASSVGNHEFDFGPGVFGYFLSQFEDSNIRFVAANLDVTGEQALRQFAQPSPGATPGALVEWTRTDVDGRSVAIVGITTPELASVSSPGPNVTVDEEIVAAAQEAIDEATMDGTNVVVLATQLQSITNDQALIEQLRGVDVGVSGGGGEILANADDVLLPSSRPPTIFGPYPLLQDSADEGTEAEVPIVTTQGLYGYVGKLVLDVSAAGVVTRIDDESGPIRNVFDGMEPPTDQREPDPTLLDTVEKPVAAFVGDLDEQIVAQTQPVLDGNTASVRTRETNLGSLFADALRITAENGADEFGATNPTVGLQNSGGIRNNVVLGPDEEVSRFDTFQIAPFSNFVGYTLDVTPEKLKQLLERSVSAALNEETGQLIAEGRFGQISGMEVVYDPERPAQTVERQDDGTVTVTSPGERIRQLTLTRNDDDPSNDVVLVRNGAIVGTQNVDLASNSFTIGQNGDDYPFNLTDEQFTNLPTSYQQSLEAYLRQLGTVTAEQFPEGGLGRIMVGGDLPDPEPEPSNPDDGGDDTDDGTEDGDDTDDGTEDGDDTDNGTEDGDDTGTDDGTEDGDDTGTDDGTDTGDDSGVRPVPAARGVDSSCPDVEVPTARFPDVPADDTHDLTVRCMAWYDIAEGFPDGSFRPLDGVSREQMASFIARTVTRAGGSLPAGPPDRFSDDNGSVHELAINQLAAVNIVLGRPDGSYAPKEIVSRGQMTTFLVRAYRHVTGTDLPAGGDYFDDTDGSEHLGSLNAAARAGFTEGVVGREFQPLAETARGQMATFLARLVDILVEEGETRPPQ